MTLGFGDYKRNGEGTGKLWPSLSSLDLGHKEEHSLAGLCGFDPLSLSSYCAGHSGLSFLLYRMTVIYKSAQATATK